MMFQKMLREKLLKIILRKLLRSKLLISSMLSFLIFALCLFFSSCGFMAGGGLGSFKQASLGGPGDGETPTLGPRIQENPKLAEEDCEDNDRCQAACRDIYPKSSSYKKCQDLTIQKVSDIENVFYALVAADPDELEDIDEDHLEDYLKIGLDSFKEKVIEKIGTRYTRLSNILSWIIAEQEVAPLLEKEDPDNEILEQIVLQYCNVDDNGKCQNADSGNPETGTNNFPIGSCAFKINTRTLGVPSERFPQTPACGADGASHHICPKLSASFFDNYSIRRNPQHSITIVAQDKRAFTYASSKKDGVVFDYSRASLYYCYKTATHSDDVNNCGNARLSDPADNTICTTLHHKKLADLDDDEDDAKELFMSLVGAGEVFFNQATGSEDAFVLGHKLLEKACTNRSNTSLNQCMKVFYCWLEDHTVSGDIDIDIDIKNILKRDDFSDKIGGDEFDLDNDCTYSRYTGI